MRRRKRKGSEVQIKEKPRSRYCNGGGTVKAKMYMCHDRD
jgi:hypothetical protein